MIRRIKPVCRAFRFEAEVRRTTAGPRGPRGGYEPAWAPAVDVSERGNSVIVEVEMPGVERSDVKVLLLPNRLEIAGRKREAPSPAGLRYHRLERAFGSFRRTIALPAAVDPARATASLENGILRVVLGKAGRIVDGVEVPVGSRD